MTDRYQAGWIQLLKQAGYSRVRRVRYDVLAPRGRMAHSELIAKLRKGVSAWNKWRQENPDISVDLSGANLSGADLRQTQLSDAVLPQSILDKADLHGADLTRAYLPSATSKRLEAKGREFV